MKDTLVRFGVAMEGSLLEELDALVEERGGTRSELLRDLVRAEVTKSRVQAGANAVASLTLVYDHHVRDLTERLTSFQHSLGDKVNSALHVHLDHDLCLEVVVLKGPADELRAAGEKLLATRGVKHGGMEVIAVGPQPKGKKAKASAHAHAHYHDGVLHVHEHDHEGDHGHGEEHDHHHHGPDDEHGHAHTHDHANDHDHGHDHHHHEHPPAVKKPPPAKKKKKDKAKRAK